MFKKFSFENLHPNHKFAFLDGLLCGILITIMVKETLEERRQMKAAELERANLRDLRDFADTSSTQD